MKSLLHVAEKHGNPHKALLQLIVHTGGIRISKIVDVFQAICTADLTPTSIPQQCTTEALSKTLCRTINAILAPIDLKIAVTTDYRFPDEQYLTLYSTTSGGKFTKLFTPDELELFQKWFNMMFVDTHHRGELDGVDSVNVEFGGRKRPLLAEAFLKKLVEDNILVKLQNHNSYIFSTKSVMELEPRLRANNYDIPQCPVCSLLVIVQRFSYTCETCQDSIHCSCLYKMINLANNTAVSCPGGNRCTAKYDKNTLEELDFDADLPETINRPIEIRSNARRTQAAEPENSDDEDVIADDDDNEEEAADVNDEAADVDDEAIDDVDEVADDNDDDEGVDENAAPEEDEAAKEDESGSEAEAADEVMEED